MHIRNVNTILMLIAGIIVALYSLISEYSLEKTAYTLILVLIIFFIIGSLMQGILNKVLESVEEEEQQALKKELDEVAQNLEEDTPE